MLRFALSALLILATSSCVESQDGGASAGVADILDPIFSEWDKPSTPGVSVAVIRDGKILYSKGFGSAQLEYDAPIKPETIFHVASVSKQFTAMAITMLAAEGKVSLDEEVRTYLPWMPDFGQPITVRHLIYHTSGLRDQWSLLGLAGWNESDLITQQHLRTIIARQRELNFAPGAAYEYSNTGYTLLAEIVEAVSGQSLDEYSRANIFEPLGMARSHFHSDHQMIVKGRAYSYSPDSEDGFRKSILNFALVGATSLFTTAEDLTLWLDNFRHARVGGPEVMAEMIQTGALNDGSPIDYAHGVSIGRYRGLDAVSHNGSDAGFRSHATWFPAPAVGIVVLSNLGSVNPSQLVTDVANALLIDDFTEPLPSLANAEATKLQAIKVDAATLEKYLGSYQLDGGPIVEIGIQDGQLTAKVGEQEFQPDAVSDTEFFVREFNAVIRFYRSDGAAEKLTLEMGGNLVDGHRIIPAAAPSPAQLAEYVGVYYSVELDTYYTLMVKDDGLVVDHLRLGEKRLKFTQEDQFTSDILAEIRFYRDAAGNLAGMRVSSGGARNVNFDRIRP